jgi:CHASE3 domain sensor protein
MASWIIPALKAMLPHVGTIVDVARPAFTKRRSGQPADQPELVQQQIGELQAAVSKNAENIQELATQLSRTVAAVEKAAQLAEARLRRVYILAVLAIVVAALAMCAPLLLR